METSRVTEGERIRTHIALAIPQPLAQYHTFQGQSNDCGPHCVAIAANTLLGARLVDPVALAAEFDQRGFPERIPGWATMPWGMVAALRRLGLRARWRVLTAPRRLFRNLRDGRITIVSIGEPLRFEKGKWAGWGHYKVLAFWQLERGLGFIDPATRAADGTTWQSLPEFMRQWTWLGRQVIEVEPVQPAAP